MFIHGAGRGREPSPEPQEWIVGEGLEEHSASAWRQNPAEFLQSSGYVQVVENADTDNEIE
jgi:hypothetical protein